MEERITLRYENLIEYGNNFFIQIAISVPTLGEPICGGWDGDCDKSLLIAVYRHGLENCEVFPTDEKLVFAAKQEVDTVDDQWKSSSVYFQVIDNWPSSTELQIRARRLISLSQKNVNDPVYDRPRYCSRLLLLIDIYSIQ